MTNPTDAPQRAHCFRLVLTEEEKGGYSTTVDGCSGCFSQGDTRDEAIENTLEALANWLRASRPNGPLSPPADEPETATCEIGVPVMCPGITPPEEVPRQQPCGNMPETGPCTFSDVRLGHPRPSPTPTCRDGCTYDEGNCYDECRPPTPTIPSVAEQREVPPTGASWMAEQAHEALFEDGAGLLDRVKPLEEMHTSKGFILHPDVRRDLAALRRDVTALAMLLADFANPAKVTLNPYEQFRRIAERDKPDLDTPDPPA